MPTVSKESIYSLCLFMSFHHSHSLSSFTTQANHVRPFGLPVAYQGHILGNGWTWVIWMAWLVPHCCTWYYYIYSIACWQTMLSCKDQLDLLLTNQYLHAWTTPKTCMEFEHKRLSNMMDSNVWNAARTTKEGFVKALGKIFWNLVFHWGIIQLQLPFAHPHPWLTRPQWKWCLCWFILHLNFGSGTDIKVSCWVLQAIPSLGQST